MSAPETYAESPVSCVFPAVPGTGEKVMPKKLHWKYLLYVLMVAYVLFVGTNMYQFNAMMEFVRQYPAEVSRETREMKTRVLEMRNTMPGLLSSPELTLDDIENIFTQQDDAQDRSLAKVRELLPEEQDKLDAVRQAFTDIRQVRRDAARTLQDNSDYNRAMEHYKRDIEPYAAKVHDALDDVFQVSENMTQRIQDEMLRRTNITILLSVIWGCAIIGALIYADRREQIKNREIAYREGLFSQLSQNVDEVFMIASDSRTFEYVSPNCIRLISLAASEISRTPEKLYTFLPPADGEWLKNILDSGDPPAGTAERDVHLEAYGKFYKIGVYSICMPSHRQERFIVTIIDQTGSFLHQQALNDALKNAHAASAAKSSFLSHMSHEIRTPLNAIIGMTTIAANRLDDRSRVADCLGKIAGSSRHLLELVNDVLDMSKIESGKLSISHEPFNLRSSIQNINNLIRPQAQARQLDFDIFLTGVDEEELCGDSLRLNQILLNILSNALKFTPRGGSIRLEIMQLAKKRNTIRLRFIISDTGIGMSEDFLQRLYQPFEQASASTAARYGGTGLGMPITSNLVSLMGGVISVRSREGEGTTFAVELPFGLSERAAEKHDSLPPLRVLIVDDDHGTCEHAALLLERMGLHPRWTLSGREAVDIAKAAHEAGSGYEVCLIDWKMPGMDGAETARNIRGVVGDDVLIIIISAYDWGPIEEEARSAGVDGFIAKPFFSSTLYDALLSSTQRLRVTAGDGPHSAGPEYDFSGRRILLVEDNEFNREIGQEFLGMANAAVEHAENGREAVDRFTASAPGYSDMKLMDVQMPVMNGHEATRAIRASGHPDARDIPILAMTADAFSEDVAAAAAAGMNGHLAKPVNINDLYRLMDMHLKKRTRQV